MHMIGAFISDISGYLYFLYDESIKAKSEVDSMSIFLNKMNDKNEIKDIFRKSSKNRSCLEKFGSYRNLKDNNGWKLVRFRMKSFPK